METVVSITVELQIGSNYLAAECILMVLVWWYIFNITFFVFAKDSYQFTSFKTVQLYKNMYMWINNNH